MSLTLTVLDLQFGSSMCTTFFSVTPAGNYAPGGDAADFTKASNTSAFVPKPVPSRVPNVPPSVLLEEMGGVYTGIITASALSGFKIKFYTGGGAEFTNATYASQGITLATFNAVGGQQLVIALVWRTGT